MKNKIELDPTTKAAVILEALPYVQRFKNSIFVIKYGGAFMDSSNPEKRKQIATDIAFLHTVGIKVVVVHGGGKSITNALSEKNIESKFKNGLRVTSKEIISVVDNVLNQKINLDICENLTEKGAATNALNGKDILKCEKKKFTDEDDPNKSFDLGFVGEIDEVKTDLIYKSLDAGKIPVISPLASDQNGLIYNTNADSAACKVAIALNARRMVYLCDVPGLMKDLDNENSLISSINVEEVNGLIKQNIISKGMIPKVESAKEAIIKGVKRVHFIYAELAHSLLLEIFTDKGIGTEIYKHKT